jgi:TonB-dependent SusC/RagA subfamily outer membrane receptor
METLFIYLAKVAISIAAFYTLYLFLFSKRKQFRFNRLYLTGSFLLSFVIPLLTFTITRSPVNQMVILPDAAITNTAALTNDPAGVNFLGVMLTFYVAFTGLFFLHLFTGYVKAFSITRKSQGKTIDGIRFLVTGKEIHPFTFFNHIVISDSTLDHPQLPMILKHEKIHATEKHSFDILVSELMFLFQWFNPFAWLQRDAIRNNLEFLTDEKVTDRNNMQSYQMAMVSLAGKKGVAPFLNALNGNDLKNRIIMMKKKTENKNKMVRQLMVLPLLVILVIGLSNKEFKAAPVAGQIRNLSEANQLNKVSIAGDSLKNKKKEIIVVGYPINKAPEDSAKTQIKSNGSKVWFVTKADGRNSKDTVKKMTFNKGNEEIQVTGYAMKSDGKNFTGDSIKIRATSGMKGNEPLYILDGKEIGTIDGISAEQIESISVLKDKSSTILYGEKGKNGVIIITSKKTGQPSDNVLIILDGKPTKKKVADINPDDIQSVNVLKGDQAMTKYGDMGKNGVIEITMKNGTEDLSGPIKTTDQLRKQIAKTIRYPTSAAGNGEFGDVKVFAFVNGAGSITQITMIPPESGFLNIDEIVVVGNIPLSISLKQNDKSSALMEEASLQVKKLPDLQIEQIRNNWVQFQFKFMLEKYDPKTDKLIK